MTTNTNTHIPADRAVGSIFGLAYGDAIGDPTEFQSYAALKGRVSIPARLRITDDTQMSLAVWAALDAWDGRSYGTLRLELTGTFLAWREDPDNTRAPGVTCMSALAKLDRQGLGSWLQCTSATSAGCGSVMRAPWIGLHPKLNDEQVVDVAMLQAVLTHGPAENAYVSAAAAALTRALARGEVVPGNASDWVLDWAARRAGVVEYFEPALGQVWRVTKTTMTSSGRSYTDREDYVDEGLAHVTWAASRGFTLAKRLAKDPWGFDPCTIAGEGWRAREAFAVALGILDGFADLHDNSATPHAESVLLRAAETNGDSDSIGAITGALVGAAYGNVFPNEWVFRLESRYRTELSTIASRLKV